MVLTINGALAILAGITGVGAIAWGVSNMPKNSGKNIGNSDDITHPGLAPALNGPSVNIGEPPKSESEPNIDDIAGGTVNGITGSTDDSATTENTNPNGNNGDDEDKKQPIAIPDATGENEETTINGNSTIDFESALKWAEAQQSKQWEREDQIRKETQEREDTAYQRAVADMRAAGINPNLLNVQPAESGGGITNATGINDTVYQAELEKYITQLQQDFEEYFTGSENDKDRMMQSISTIIMLVGLMSKFGKK